MTNWVEDEIAEIHAEKEKHEKHKYLDGHPRWKCFAAMVALLCIFAYSLNLQGQVFSCPDCDKRFELRSVDPRIQSDANWKCLRCGKQNWKADRPYTCSNCGAHIGEQ